MTCPHCGQRVDDSVDRLRKKRRTLGLCVACGKPSGKYARCVDCRIMAARYQRLRRNGPQIVV